MGYAFVSMGAAEAAPQNQYDAIVAQIRLEFPDFKIVKKSDSSLMRMLDSLLRVVTLGGQKKFLTSYETTLGNTVYVSDNWDSLSDTTKAIVLAHEREHMRQRRIYGRVGYSFLWLIPALPMGLAIGRARLEWGGYRQTILSTSILRGPAAACSSTMRERIVGQFTGPAYGWMWPFRGQVESWYDQALRDAGVDCGKVKPG